MSDEIQVETVEGPGGGLLKRFPHEGAIETVCLTRTGVVHACPFEDERDAGEVVIDYEPRKWLLELRSLDEYLDGFEEMKVSHEELTQIIAADISAALECCVHVETRYETASVRMRATSGARIF